MSNQKINNIVITDIMGHENIATTKQYYIQTDKQKLKLSMNSLNFRKTSQKALIIGFFLDISFSPTDKVNEYLF